MPTNNAQNWKLIDLDTGEEIEGSYPAMGISEEFSTTYSDTWALGRDDPVIQWTHGQSRQVQVPVRIYAKHSQQSVKEELDRLKECIASDPELGRPHIFRFVLGQVINERVVIENIGGIAYDAPRQDGSMRGCICALSMRRYIPFDIELTDPNAPPGGTRYYRAARAETYEHVSRTLYRSPHIGDLLRRLHPGQPILQAGDLVVAPDPKDLRHLRLEPYSIPLTRTRDFLELRRVVFARMNKDYVSHRIRSWS